MAFKTIPEVLELYCPTARLMPLTLSRENITQWSNATLAKHRSNQEYTNCNRKYTMQMWSKVLCSVSFMLCFALKLEDVTVTEPNQFAIRWRIAGTANVPFPGLKIKPYIVGAFAFAQSRCQQCYHLQMFAAWWRLETALAHLWVLSSFVVQHTCASHAAQWWSMMINVYFWKVHSHVFLKLQIQMPKVVN